MVKRVIFGKIQNLILIYVFIHLFTQYIKRKKI